MSESSHSSIVFTVSADDRPGVVQSLSDVALAHNASWLESSLSHLCGQFVGIVRLSVPQAERDALLTALQGLSANGIIVSEKRSPANDKDEIRDTVELYLEANDRPGIIEEITSVIASTNINIEQLETWCESASMAGYDLFVAQLSVSLPAGCEIEKLEMILESVSDDLMVSIVEPAA